MLCGDETVQNPHYIPLVLYDLGILICISHALSNNWIYFSYISSKYLDWMSCENDLWDPSGEYTCHLHPGVYIMQNIMVFGGGVAAGRKKRGRGRGKLEKGG